MILEAVALLTAFFVGASAAAVPVEPPVDWKGISYVLGGVILTMGGIVAKLYRDCRAKDRELVRVQTQHEEFLKGLLDDLMP